MRISPLRQRMIDDMTARHFSEKAQKDYIRCVKNLAAFIGRPPETATAEDLRLYRLHLVQSPLGASSVNSYMTALRFFFSITLDRYQLRKPLFRVEQPRKLPTVLTQEEVAHLLDAAPSAKYKAALSVAYGAGLIPNPVNHFSGLGVGHQWKSVLARIISRWLARATQRSPTSLSRSWMVSK